MDDTVIFISDECLYYALLSDVEEIVKEAEIIFDYLSYRNLNKKIIVNPSIYRRLHNLFEKNKECLLYFKNYYELAGYINDYKDSKKEIMLLARVLKVLNEKVYIISDKFQGDKEFLDEMEKIKVEVFTVHEAYSYILGKRDFRDYITSLK